MVEQVNVNLAAKQVKLRLGPDAAKYILEKTCGDRSYGARPLRRAERCCTRSKRHVKFVAYNGIEGGHQNRKRVGRGI